MIGREPPAVLGLVGAAKEYAALSGQFQPDDAIRAAGDTDDLDTMVAVSAHLASTCDTRAGEGPAWVMRRGERRTILGRIAERGGLADAVASRRQQGAVDPATDDLLAALLGEGIFGDAEVQARVDGATADAPDDLVRIALALERAGTLAPAAARLESVKAVLARGQADRRGRTLLARGFFGRVVELERIAAWIERPVTEPPVKGLYITGDPGIGKSTLLDEAVRRAMDGRTDRILVRLDFDRAGLDATDWVGLTVELALQVAAQVPDAAASLQAARLQAVSQDAPAAFTKGDTGRVQLPSALASELRTTLEATRQTLLVVLDTLEVLRARGSRQPGRVFAWLDQVVSQVAPVAVLAAGRGDAFPSSDEAERLGEQVRVEEQVRLTGLEDAVVDAMLAREQVPESAFAAIRGAAKGNPLAVRLAAKLVREGGPEALDEVAGGEADVTAGLLYRILLARINDDELRALAYPGLIVRRIDAAVIGEVLGPALDMGEIPPERAAKLFETLASEHWLVERFEGNDFAIHQPDIRRMMLPLLYADDPKRCATIDRAAAAWFGRKDEEWARVESAYHRLQSMRRSKRVPQLDPAVLRQLDTDAIAELPPVAQDLVHRARDERSTQFRGGEAQAPGTPLDPSAAVELAATLERGDLLEGQYLYDQTFAVAMFSARAPEADTARSYLWRTGAWADARRLDDERRRLGAKDLDLPQRPLDALVRLEMWAEGRFDDLRTAIGRTPDLLARATELRQRSARADLSTGALGFALRSLGPVTAPSESIQQDSVGTAFAAWAPELAAYGERRDAVSASQRRLASVLGASPTIDPSDDATLARLLAIDTPYATTLTALVQVRASNAYGASGGRTTDHLLAVLGALAGLGGIAPSAAGSWAMAADGDTSPAGLVERMTSLGLLAEWLGAAAFAWRDPDLRLLAESAERWRRTTAGSWSFADPPKGANAWERAVDVTVADRVGALERAADPRAEATAQLAAWSVGYDGVRLHRAIRSRYARILTGLDARSPIEAAAVLLEGRVPAAFVPAIAVLEAGKERNA